MKPIASSSPEKPPSAKATFLTRLSTRAVLGILSRFNRAAIRMICPDGTVRTFGTPIPGEDPAEIHVHNHRFFRRVLLHGEIGFGEGYMDGDWTTPDLTGLIAAMIENLERIPHMSGSRMKATGYHVLKTFNTFAHWRRRNTRQNSQRNIHAHYDLSNDFYALWLDPSMTYSSAWFNGAEDLRQAQENKYQRLCEKLRLRPGMHVLEIGCGWGGFSIHAAHHYGVKVTAITISEEQYRKARERVHAEGLTDSIDIQLTDYRDVRGSFDAIASIEMLEAVGHQYLTTFFDQCHQLLNPDGCLGLQVIVCPDSRYEAMRKSTDWIKKHIFPGGQLPSVKALMDSINATGDLYLQHLESFGLHYAKTLRIWRERFNRQREAVMELGFDESFVRKWNYYLAYCEAAFATRNINVSQMIFTRPNNTRFALEC